MLGISQFVVAVNKMDLAGFRRKAFEAIKSSLEGLFDGQNLSYRVVPVSGLTGDNIVTPSKRMSWSSGETVLSVLEGFTTHKTMSRELVFSIQYLQRIPGGGRRYLGSLSSGELKIGQALQSTRYPGKFFTVTGLIHSGVTKDRVFAPAEVSLEIDSDVDLERGDVLAASGKIEYTDQFEADLVWLDEEPGFAGRPFVLRLGHSSTKTTITTTI
jgi:bifunctional enzyme CysN/CysC